MLLELNTKYVSDLNLEDYGGVEGRGRPSKYGWKQKLSPLEVNGDALLVHANDEAELKQLLASVRGWAFQKQRNNGRRYAVRKTSSTSFGVWRLA